jgi:hypothetical protein
MTMKTEIYSSQVKRGSATRYAWKCTRLNAVVNGVIVAATGRLLSWKSGNYSAQANRIADDFTNRFSGKEISALEAYHMAIDRCQNSPNGIVALREQMRNEIYNAD